MNRGIAALVALALGACQPAPLTNRTSFNPDEVAWASASGNNTVTGFAVLRTVGGEARTCAGLTVQLVPDSAYARDRLMQLYGNTARGSRSLAGAPRFADQDPRYLATARETRCDGQGNFTFEKVPDGTWYAIATVVWASNPRYGLTEGGGMMQRVEPRGGQTIKLAMP